MAALCAICAIVLLAISPWLGLSAYDLSRNMRGSAPYLLAALATVGVATGGFAALLFAQVQP
jgi:hypothetical protein